MIFVYPAVVSDSCESKMIPAVCKCVERFFLVQLQDAFASGVLKAKQEFNPVNRIYGPIMLESKAVNKTDSLVLMEGTKEYTPNDKVTYSMDRFDVTVHNHTSNSDDTFFCSMISDYELLYAFPRIKSTDADELNSTLNELEIIIKDLRDVESIAEHQVNEVSSLVKQWRNESKDVVNMDQNSPKPQKSLEGIEGVNRATLSKIQSDIKRAQRYSDSLINELNKSVRTDEEKVKEKEFGTSIGTYRPTDYKIDLTPTAANVEVPIRYSGGPKDGASGADSGNTTNLPVGVKVLPMKCEDFKSIEKALLDDYFMKTSKSFYERMYRGLKKRGLQIYSKLMHRIGFKNYDAADELYKNRDDFVKQNITMAPSGFVNASAFRHSVDAPDNYNFTSAVVIFNKSDIDEQYADIFSNRPAMNRLFKLGWTTFCVLDPITEVMYFISSVDGGYLHELNYQYIYNSLGIESIFSSGSALRSAARPFSIKTGNFMTFAKKMRQLSNEQQS